MSLLDGLREIFSEAPEWKGRRFEQYVLSLFDEQYFDLVEKTHSFRTNEDRFVESSLNPDFILRYRPKNELFAVEAKYRSRLNPEKMLEWSNPQQLNRYRDFARKRGIPLFIVVGLGGIDDEPREMFCIPLESAKYPALYPSVYLQYGRNPTSRFFWKDGMLK